MRFLAKLILVSLFSTGLLFSTISSTAGISSELQIEQYRPGIFIPQPSREDVVIFSENFDDGFPVNWSTEDVTDPGSYWYISNFNSFDSLSWRVADPQINGYRDDWYQVLDTPEISLPNSSSLILSFEQFRAIEEPATYQNFDGWDGFNVRIRLAGQPYEQAEILTNCSPAYNSSSLYSFGSIHQEDPDGEPGIPGWAGSVDWTSTTVQIPSSYAGESVIISFAFASDGATSTLTNPEFTGVFIDDINVADVFINDGSSTAGFVGVTNTEIGGDLWHVYQDSTALSQPNAIGCFDIDSLKYNPNMENYLTSQITSLPLGASYSLDFSLKTQLDDAAYPESDYFSVEVKYSNMGIWSNWNSISNPTGDPNLPNVVFTGSVDEWVHFSSGWQGYNDLSILAGHPVQFRIGLHSNDDKPTGFGIKLDDFRVIQTSFPAEPPANLLGELLYNGSTFLSWEAPSADVIEYKIFRQTADDTELEFLTTTTFSSFIDDTPAEGNITYAVSAVLDNGLGETDLSNEFNLFVPSTTAVILGNDDGVPDGAFMPGILRNAAVQLDLPNSDSLTITHINVYIADMNYGPLSVSAWYDENGLPGELYSGFPISIPNSELVIGWNTIPILHEDLIPVTGDKVFIGIKQFIGGPAVGIDAGSAGYSYIENDDWQLITLGNLMLRAILNDYIISQEPPADPPSNKITRFTNYPNPFNPETTISFNLSSSEDVIINVYNMKGQIVKTLLERKLPAGLSSVAWDGRNQKGKQVSSGLYLYKIITDKEKKSGKMLLLK